MKHDGSSIADTARQQRQSLASIAAEQDRRT